ncbi:polysaccharide pyruvyl transferase family protein [Formosa undariae]|uniref:Polysaccharide pyruvyl transferase family protein n=1 Tax=Formosa undariae TaxID=1325436 RepID=A0ABV5EWA5_9FLAO
MYIQVDNAGFINKGAQLMLRATIDKLYKEDKKKYKVVAGRNCLFTDQSQIRKAGLYQIPNFKRFKITIDDFISEYFLQKYGLVKETDIKVILDAGGFQFGDQWISFYSEKYLTEIKEYYSKKKKNGVKIIFLPQAFGPFNDELSKEVMKTVFEYGDVFYARDKTSYKYITELFPNSDKIKLAPDFTCLFEADIPSKLFKKVKGGICIIPNSKMLTHTDDKVGDKYLSYLSDLIVHFKNINEKIILLNHEGNDDWELIKQLEKNLDGYNNYLVLNNLDAIEVKGVIGNSKLLISSRFHGVVSGLNQSIPTFCTSWSHKYEELMKDYGFENNILAMDDFIFEIKKITNFLDADLNSSSSNVENIKEQTEDMWKEVISFFN